MRASSNLALALAAVQLTPVTAERILGAYIFARHGDRTPKVFGDTQLTDLGHHEVYQVGSYYHDRYIAPKSDLQIAGISDPTVNLSQITAVAPSDEVIQNSAMGFLQGLYPPVGKSDSSQTLRNGTTVEAPLDGYQLIPLGEVSTGSDSENNQWLQQASDCKKATASSNSFYSSSLYRELLDSTKDFYQSLSPVLDGEFTDKEMSFKKAYTIFDYINVAMIHNATDTTPKLNDLSKEDLHQLSTLASAQQYNLAYNHSDTVRAAAGAVLAGQVVDALGQTISSKGSSKLNIQFGSYATFLSYFGLANMPNTNTDFAGIPDYASSMAWELVTNSTDGFPSESDISVRFIFHNGTITSTSQPSAWPLFGQSSLLLPWSEFADRTKRFSINSEEDWCKACGNTDGQCAQFVKSTADAGTPSSSSNSGGMSLAVAGVIGAMVTLAVILGLEGLFLLVGGFRLSKKRPAGSDVGSTVVTENKIPA
ncbi:hypothetical protein PHISCL_00192 [Aspergillus sclerotialis]|uniref:Histidine acid phosphatase n=1 Tax=Aspergillus sclerotialis TaxID=2070753 RepID=A0A3A2ZWD5_9EURO|nr:hypothetical protein PHISCL_00192 [Aspergillus sclerotialis]